jgi:hypothetical protein
MSFGIKTFNAAGDLILNSDDASRITYLLRSSGTVTTGTSTNTTNVVTFGSASVSGIGAGGEILVFVKPKDYAGDVNVYGTPVNNGDGFLIYSMPGNIEFEYLIFEQSSDKTPAGTGYGFEIYSQEGILLFTGDYFTTKVRTILEGNGATYAETGKNIYASLFQVPNYTTATQSGQLFFIRTEGRMLKFNGTSSISITEDLMRAYTQAGGGITYSYYANTNTAARTIIFGA